MAIHSTLKGLAVGTFSIHFAALFHTLRSSAPLLSLRSYSPNGYLFNAFSAFSAALNILWLKGLPIGQEYNRNVIQPSIDKNVHKACHNGEKQALSELQVQESVILKSTFLPFYIVGNILFIVSSILAGEDLDELSHIFAVSNFVLQIVLLYILAEDDRNAVITPGTFLTHLVMKTNIGLNVLFIWRSWSILDKMRNPSIDQLAAVSMAFFLITISSGPDPILGLSMLFVVITLIVGDENSSIGNIGNVTTWQFTFRLLTIPITACLGLEFILSKRRNFQWLSGWNTTS